MGVMTESVPTTPARENGQTNSHFLLGAIIGFLWLSLGLSTYLNNLALFFVNADLDDRSIFPAKIGGLIWLIAGIWVSGYVTGVLLGILTGRENRRSMIVSAIVSYELMVIFRLVVLEAFPLIQQDAFEDVYHSLTLSGVPGHISFLLLTMGFGALLVWLAVYTGYVVSQMFEQLRTLQFELDPRIIMGTTVLPAALLLTMWSLTNLADWEKIEAANRPSFEPFTLLHVDIFLNPALHMIMTAIVGLLVGLSPYSRGLFKVLLSAALGTMTYVLLAFVTKDLLVLYAPADYKDALDFGYPNLILFTLLWLGTVFTAVASAFAFYNIRLILFGNPADRHRRKSDQSVMVIESEHIQ